MNVAILKMVSFPSLQVVSTVLSGSRIAADGQTTLQRPFRV